MDYASIMSAALRSPGRAPDSSVMTRPAELEWQPEYVREPPLESVSPEDWIPSPKSVVTALKGAPLLMGAISKNLQKEGRNYEGLLFGGAYGANQLRLAGRGAPKIKMIKQSRESYNRLRQEAGLEPVTDWSNLPSTLIQRLDIE